MTGRSLPSATVRRSVEGKGFITTLKTQTAPSPMESLAGSSPPAEQDTPKKDYLEHE